MSGMILRLRGTIPAATSRLYVCSRPSRAASAIDPAGAKRPVVVKVGWAVRYAGTDDRFGLACADDRGDCSGPSTFANGKQRHLSTKKKKKKKKKKEKILLFFCVLL